MLDRTIINGQPATVAFLKGNMVPATQEEATYLKVIFDDGRVLFALRDDDITRGTKQ